MSQKKTQLTPQEITAFLQKQFAASATNLQQLVEGEESQAFSYGCNAKEYVIRINQHITGFQKDAYAGDPLFDVATALFWSPWLDCMAAQAAHFEPYISGFPHSQERLVCYQLYIGLAEIYDSALRQKGEMIRWALQRSMEIVHNFRTA